MNIAICGWCDAHPQLPLHALASRHTDLACGMNFALMKGVGEGIDRPGTTPVLDPRPGMCCVVLRLGTK